MMLEQSSRFEETVLAGYKIAHIILHGFSPPPFTRSKQVQWVYMKCQARMIEWYCTHLDIYGRQSVARGPMGLEALLMNEPSDLKAISRSAEVIKLSVRKRAFEALTLADTLHELFDREAHKSSHQSEENSPTLRKLDEINPVLGMYVTTAKQLMEQIIKNIPYSNIPFCSQTIIRTANEKIAQPHA